MAHHDRIRQALEESRGELAATAAPTVHLTRVVNARAPGKPEDDSRVLNAMGAPHLPRRRQPGILSRTVQERSRCPSLDSISSCSISSVIDGVSPRRGADWPPLSRPSASADSVVMEDVATRPARKRSLSPLPSEIVVSITNI
jgi:hypothetical protein